MERRTRTPAEDPATRPVKDSRREEAEKQNQRQNGGRQDAGEYEDLRVAIHRAAWKVRRQHPKVQVTFDAVRRYMVRLRRWPRRPPTGVKT